MLGFKIFNSAVFNIKTRKATTQKILTFFGFILNIKYYSQKYDIIFFSGKESLRDANYAAKLFNAPKNNLTKKDLTESESQIENVVLFLNNSNEIVSKALKKAQSSKLEIPLML